MKERVLCDINQIYKNGGVEYALSKYVNRDHWVLKFKSAFTENHIENLTDFNYSKCFTICINISPTNANVGTEKFGDYIKKECILDRIQVQISAVAPYAMFKYIRYEYKDEETNYSDSFKAYKEQDSIVGNNVTNFLISNNLIILDPDILSIEVPEVTLELREENGTVYHCLFEDGY